MPTNLPPGYIEDLGCRHDEKYMEKDEDGFWYCTKCEQDPDDFEEPDFTGASDEIGYANDR